MKKNNENSKVRTNVITILENYKKYKTLIDLNNKKNYISNEELNDFFIKNIHIYVLYVESAFELLKQSEKRLIQNKLSAKKTVDQQCKELNITTSTYYDKWKKIYENLDASFYFYKIYALNEELEKNNPAIK
mgnify:CR=1 FL=1